MTVEAANSNARALWVKLIGATSLAPKLQIHWRNIENERFIYGLSTKDKNFAQHKYYPSVLENC